jgi:hypothetical protein
MNNDGGYNFNSANGSPAEGLDERQGGNSGGLSVVRSREEKGAGGAVTVVPFKLHGGAVWM